MTEEQLTGETPAPVTQDELDREIQMDQDDETKAAFAQADLEQAAMEAETLESPPEEAQEILRKDRVPGQVEAKNLATPTPESPPVEETPGYVAGMEGQPQAAQPNLPTPPAPKETPPDPESGPTMVQRADGVIGMKTAAGEAPKDQTQRKPSKTPIPFDPENITYEKDADFCAVIDGLIPTDSELWIHPEKNEVVYAFGLPQARAGKHFDLLKASREHVVEFIYLQIWKKCGMGSSCKDIDAARVLLKLLMQFPTKSAAFMCQRVVINAGRLKLGGPGANDGLDGRWGGQTRSAIYADLCKHYDQTRMALYAEAYNQLSSWAAQEPEVWNLVLQMYVTRRI